MLLAALLGLVAGFVRGGRFRRVGVAGFRRWPLLVAGVAFQVVGPWLPDGVGVTAVVLSFALLIVFALSNLQLTGMAVVTIGMAMTATTIAVNGGMPVRAAAVVDAGIAEEADVADLEGVDLGPKRHLERDDDTLMVLSDIIPVALSREVLSFGDLVMSFGLADVLYRLLRRQPRRGVPPAVDEVAALGA
jgi:hypothetical protein